MQPFERGPAPDLLNRYGREIAQDYVEKKTANPKHQFQWPQREDRSVYSETRQALRELTVGHCSYCDGYPVDESGEEQVDHFKPKSRPEFFELVGDWKNLFFACCACNKAKLAQWEEALLRPDSDDFEFERYFIFESDSGKLAPNPTVGPADQHRALRTIEILGLNRPGLCTGRRRTAKSLLTCSKNDINDWGYRFLIPICRDDLEDGSSSRDQN